MHLGVWHWHQRISALTAMICWSATLAIERSNDGGTTYSAATAFINATTNYIQLNGALFAASGGFQGPAAGCTHIRVRCPASSYTSGTATIKLQGGVGDNFLMGTVAVQGAIPAGASGTQPNPVMVGGSDGSYLRALATDGFGDVKTILADATGTVSITSSGAQTAVTTNGGGTLSFSLSGASTLTTATFQLEGTVDGSNWTPVQFHQLVTASSGGQLQGGAILNYTTTSTTAIMFEASSSGFRQMRLNFTGTFTITGTITMTYTVQQTPLSIRPPVPQAPGYLSVATNSSTAIVSAPGAGLSIYVTGFQASNAGGSAMTCSLLAGSTTYFVMYLAASGGGAGRDFSVPWKLPVNTALNGQNGSSQQAYYTANYYIAP